MRRNRRFKQHVRLVMVGGALLVGIACGDSGDTSSGSGAGADVQQPTGTAVATTSPAAATAKATDAYVRQVEALVNELAVAAAAVADVMSDADVDSAEWRDDATQTLTAFATVQEAAEALEAGNDVEHIQDRLLTTTELYHHAAALVSDSIESLDLDALEEANIALGDALVAAAEVRLLIEELDNG